jgi:O-antigen ligase
VAALALLMRALPRAVPLLAVAALPFRVPIPTESRTVNLLIPLYAVVAAGLIAHLLPRVLRRGGPCVYRSGRGPMGLDWLLVAAVGLYAVQISYSADPTKGVENLVFFYLPFLALYVLLREAPWTPRLVLACFAVAVGLAALFAGVGFVEYARRELLLNPRVVAANRFDDYFRVNSLFFDPSIYGRFLALVMLAVTSAVLWSRGGRRTLIGGALLLWLWGGLITSFSQSSILALLVGLAVLAGLRWGMLRTAVATGALALVALLVLLAAPASLHLGLKGAEGSANNATNGRASLVTGGLRLFADRPLSGWGSGSFEAQYKRHNRVTQAGAASASHTIPITIAAEQGIAGLALYAALLAVAFLVLLRGAGLRGAARSPPRPGADVLESAAVGPALAACLAALVAHTFAYADFLEDPFTWTLLAVGVALFPLGRSTAPRAALSRTAPAPSGRPAHAPVGSAAEVP